MTTTTTMMRPPLLLLLLLLAVAVASGSGAAAAAEPANVAAAAAAEQLPGSRNDGNPLPVRPAATVAASRTPRRQRHHRELAAAKLRGGAAASSSPIWGGGGGGGGGGTSTRRAPPISRDQRGRTSSQQGQAFSPLRNEVNGRDDEASRAAAKEAMDAFLTRDSRNTFVGAFMLPYELWRLVCAAVQAAQRGSKRSISLTHPRSSLPSFIRFCLSSLCR